MACEQFENRILDFLENQLPLTERASVEAHLAGCTECQAFARQLEQLDAALLRRVKTPKLSENFNHKLSSRIQAEVIVLSRTELAERKRQLQAEYEAGLAKLGWRLPNFTRLLNNLSYAFLVIAAACVVWQFTPALAGLLNRQGIVGFEQSLLLSLLTSAVFVAIGLTAAFPRQFRRLLGAV